MFQGEVQTSSAIGTIVIALGEIQAIKSVEIS
jgi:hypothetical protein